MIVDDAPAPIEPAEVHVTTCPEAPQLQPLPVPLVNYKSGPSVAVTVIVPLLASVPALLTVIV